MNHEKPSFVRQYYLPYFIFSLPLKDWRERKERIVQKDVNCTSSELMLLCNYK